MQLRGHRKVHITGVGVEVNRVVLPILEIGADRVVLVEGLKETKDYTPFVDAVERELRRRLRGREVERVRIDLFDIEKLLGGLGRLILREKGESNTVFVNVSVGSRLYDAAGVIASLMFGAVAYYAEAGSYWQPISTYYDRRKLPRGTVRTIRSIIEIPRFEIKPPREDWVRLLALLSGNAGAGRGCSQSALVEAARGAGLISTPDGAQPRTGRREAARSLAELRRKFLEPMVREGWIEVEGRRRAARLRPTELGTRMLSIFSPIFLEGR
ncbi:MAG: HFX_2341 family transcriptional regulator domain-containing protein [Thermoplasmatota archaeon]